MPTTLETAIINAAKRANAAYERLSGGWWLWHAPESFLQCEIARAIGKEYWVFIDASIKKTKQDMLPSRGRIRNDSRKRFDISIWQKTNQRLRAVIEIKRALSITSILGDTRKIERAFKYANSAKNGYVLVYSEAKQRKTLEQRFKKWAKDLDWICSDYFVIKPRQQDYAWGIVLLKYAKESRQQP